MKNLYELLDLPNFSSYHDVKLRYQQLARKWHPDKHMLNDLKISKDDAASEFIKIAEAWEILSDPISKEKFDVELKQSQREEDYTVNEVITINDFEAESCLSVNCNNTRNECDQSENVYVYYCRCGGDYRLLQCDLQQNVLPAIIGCGNCSLHVEVLPGT